MTTSAAEEPVFDVAVVGAGPAGLAAACAAAEAGARVALVDGAGRTGGQYWRHRADGAAGTTRRSRQVFAALAARLAAAGVTHLPHHHVRTVTGAAGGWTLTCQTGAEPRAATGDTAVRARRLVLATGAYDRQLPFPGWDLSGVMAAGGVQALLKGHGVLAGRRVVVAGTGPFLLPVATGLIEYGAQVPLVVEANSPLGLARHPRVLPVALGKLGEAAGYAARLARARTPLRSRHAVVRALGDGRLEAVEIARLDRAGRRTGGVETVPCDVLAVGWGFTAQLELHLQVGCATAVGADGGLVVGVDDAQRTSVDGVWAAGEATGVGGADLAVVEGGIAGRAAAGGDQDPRLLARRARLRAFAAALHAVHPVPAFLREDLGDDVLVCRCEEVTAGAVREAVRVWGATDARTAKLFTRAGMGWCQGRVCGFGVAGLTAGACGRGAAHDDLRAFAERPLAVPVSLGVLARPEPDDG